MRKRSAALAALSIAIFQSLVLVASPAGAADLGVTADSCAVQSGTLFAAGDGDTKAMLITVGGTNLRCQVGAVDQTFALTAITRVVVTSEGPLTFGLKDTADAAPFRSATYPSVPWSVSAASIAFDAGAVDDTRYPVSVTIGDTSFRIGQAGGTIVSNGAWSFTGSDGNDTLDATGVSKARVTANGGDGDDTISGGADDDTISGGDGDDLIDGKDGDDVLAAGKGDDTVYGGPADDQLDCADSATVDEADACWGEEGDDAIRGNLPSIGRDVVAPGDGVDDVNATYILTYEDSSEPIEASLKDGQVTSDAGDDLFGVIGIFVGSPAADTIVGSTDDDTIRGGGGDDLISGLGDADTLGGGAGNDVLKGGPGSDKAVGGSGDDRLVGGYGRDVLRGGTGADKAVGGFGQDLCLAETKVSCELA